jgi:hypothetical protein
MVSKKLHIFTKAHDFDMSFIIEWDGMAAISWHGSSSKTRELGVKKFFRPVKYNLHLGATSLNAGRTVIFCHASGKENMQSQPIIFIPIFPAIADMREIENNLIIDNSFLWGKWKGRSTSGSSRRWSTWWCSISFVWISLLEVTL